MAGTVFQPEAEYRVRFVQRQKESGLFSDSSEAGERQFQELRTDMRIRPGGGFSLLFGAVLRVWDWVTRYAPTGQSTTVKNDITAAGTAQAEVWVKI